MEEVARREIKEKGLRNVTVSYNLFMLINLFQRSIGEKGLRNVDRKYVYTPRNGKFHRVYR